MKRTVYCLLLIFCTQCKEIYLPFNNSTSGNGSGMLVVEGYINSNGPTNIKLSRTTALAERSIVPEENASVIIEGENNSQYPVIEKAKGDYSTDSLSLNSSTRYRLKIKTSNNKEYTSDYRNLVLTPVIDSISWIRSDGVDIYINVTAPGNPTQYYKWDYDETWEFDSETHTSVKYTYDILPNGDKHYTGIEYYYQPERLYEAGTRYNDSIFTCWRTENSTKVMLASTKQLSQNKIINPIRHIQEDAWELSKLYSIIVTQYGLASDAYEFFSIMKKNTESLGTTFDAQPSELRGNIKCTSDTSELIIGFIEAGAIQQKRIFIKVSELRGWEYVQPCREGAVVSNDAYSIMWDGVLYGLIPSYVDFTMVDTAYPFKIRTAVVTDKYCVDCTLRGSNIKPAFWP